MKNNASLLVKNTSMLYFRTILLIGVGLFTSRLILKALGVEDFGIYTLVSGFVLFFSFLNNALAAASSRFLSIDVAKNDIENSKHTFESIFSAHLILGIIIFILLETLGIWILNTYLVIPVERLDTANFVFHFSTFSTFIMIIQVPLTGIIIAREEMQTFAYVGLFDAFTKLSVAYFILNYEGDKLVVYSLMLLCASLIVFFFYNLYCKKQFPEYSLRLSYDRKFIIEILNFTSWSFVGSLSSILKNQGSNILLNLFFGPRLNAASGISYMVANASNSLTTGFNTAIRPQIIKSYANKEKVKTLNLIHSGSKISFLIMYTTCLCLIIETDFILNLWLVEVPEYAILFTRLMLLNMLVDSFTHSMGAAVQANGNIKYHQIVISGFLLLNVPVSYAFLRFDFSAEIIFIVSIIISVIALVLRLFFMDFLIPQFRILTFVKDVFLRCFLVTLFSFILTYSVMYTMDYGLLRFICTILMALSSSLLFIWLIGLKKNEKHIISQLIQTRVFGKNK